MSGVSCDGDADWYLVRRAPGFGVTAKLFYDEAGGSARTFVLDLLDGGPGTIEDPYAD